MSVQVVGCTPVPGSFPGLWSQVLSRGYPILWSHVLSGGYPSPDLEGGTPIPAGGVPVTPVLAGGYPSPGQGYPWTGLGYPPPDQDRTGVPLPTRTGLEYPPPPPPPEPGLGYPLSPPPAPRKWLRRGGMPLAVSRREAFLYVLRKHIFCRHLVIIEQVGTLSVKTACLEGKEVLRHQKNCDPRGHGLRVTRKIELSIVTFHTAFVPVPFLFSKTCVHFPFYKSVNHLSFRSRETKWPFLRELFKSSLM